MLLQEFNRQSRVFQHVRQLTQRPGTTRTSRNPRSSTSILLSTSRSLRRTLFSTVSQLWRTLRRLLLHTEPESTLSSVSILETSCSTQLSLRFIHTRNMSKRESQLRNFQRSPEGKLLPSHRDSSKQLTLELSTSPLSLSAFTRLIRQLRP